MKLDLRRFFAIAGLVASAVSLCTQAARAETAKPRATLPLHYGASCPPPGDPSGITIKDSPKGPVVTFERPDLGALESRDDNLAFVSRRFFFKLRTATELIEFQGRAEDGELEGLLSDAHGARHITLPVVPAGAQPACGVRP